MRILYVDVDSLRPDHLGCYGYERNTSPTIDGLAEAGTRFENVYASDTPCLPSRTALFSGRFGVHTGLINHGGINADPRPLGSERGFRIATGFESWMTALGEAGYHTATISPFPKRHAAFHVLAGFDELRDPGGTGRTRADEVIPYAEEWLERNAADDDWFLHVNFWDPHTEYDTPMEYGNPFEDDPAPEWYTEETLADHRDRYGPHSAREPEGVGLAWNESWDLPRMPDEIASLEDFDKWVDGYDVGVRYMDDHVAKLLDVLEAEGVREETLIVVSADHGENLGELNVYGDHHTADEYTSHVPLIIEGPDVEPGVDDALRYQLDLAATIVEYAGGDVPDRWDGRSFAGTLLGDGAQAEDGQWDDVGDSSDDGRDYLVLSHGAWACQRAIRWDDWLLLKTYHDGHKQILADVMLFDLSADPHETENLASERPDVVREGLSLLQQWHDDRMVEAAQGRRGGNPDTPRGVTDPMWEVLREGGPYHARRDIEPYAEHLESTERTEQAAELRRRAGTPRSHDGDGADSQSG